MSKQNSTVASGGTSFFSLLAVLFIGLKLTHVIDWSWAWVLAPLWLPISILLAVILGIGLISLLAMSFVGTFGWVTKRRRSKW